MKKQILYSILMMLPMVASADDTGKCGTYLTWTYVESTHTLTISGSGAMWNYSYMSSAPWSSYRSMVAKAIIEDGVTSIGKYAFFECGILTSVTIGKDVTAIGENAFGGCGNLASVHVTNLAAWCGISFDDYNTNPLSKAHRLFFNGTEIKNLVIPDGVTSIGDNAFGGCSGLTSVTIPNSVKSIGNSAFNGCSGLESIKVPVTNFSAFCNNTIIGLISSKISKPVILIDENGSEIKEYFIPNDVTSIGDRAFDNCYGLTSVTIGSGVTSIGEWAFDGCSGLTSVTIPNSVTSIGRSAFSACI